MSELIDKILNKLKDLYPHFDIRISTTIKNRAIILVNDKKLNEFNPSLVERELEFLKDRPDYLDLFIQAIKDPIDVYNKKMHKTLKSGIYSKGLSLQQIKESMLHTKSCRSAARYLNVSFGTYKKYAKMYLDEDGISLYDKHKNPRGKGITKGNYAPNFGRYSLQDIFDGKAADSYPKWRLQMRLINNSVIEEKCAICGFEERRITDYKVPLMLDFVDGNESNRKLENLRVLCYNCYFLNTGHFFWKQYKKAEHKNKLL